MSAERSVETARNDEFSTITVSPALTAAEFTSLPRPRSFGSEGIETTDFLGVYEEGDTSTLAFESRVFGLKSDRDFLAYAHLIAGHLGSRVLQTEMQGLS